ncbi:MAG: phosphoribosylformylglycinamidine synthase subunit PurQ [Bacteroidia bacterium]|nr:phosphoribosylformylglycinamidine synthase subunit PurQ [Bacteroidia bacterium]NNM16076.1 phosphoribosylformylglycinamidine synthase subunit PurQ [Bacteroidia bacterium]
MKCGVVVFPGSNCDHDMIDTLNLFKDKHGVEVVELWHKDHDLKNCDVIFLPGGFSYGDYLRSGAIARFSPIMKEVIEFANNGGKVVGICNGFQILCEAHLLPGALLHNNSHRFICKNVHLKSTGANSFFTSGLDTNKAYKIPIAHGEGRYHADEASLKELEANNQVLLKYCDESGNISDEANPNGSIQHIAGICNKDRNVIGMMPHPERAVDPALANSDGVAFFTSLFELELA